jgi:AcrR family transcriptional regulator
MKGRTDMVSQDRAERTRRRLLQAAATEFSLNGYGDTSLQRICGSAGVTMGALTFHYPTKMALATAVHTHGVALTRAAVRDAAAHGEAEGGEDSPRLLRIIGITHALARLLQEEPAVRAAGRLSRDRTLDQEHWHDSWLPYVHELLEQAHEEAELRAEVDPKVMAVLTRFLVSGLEATAQAGGICPECLGHLGAAWDLVLSGVTDGGHAR